MSKRPIATIKAVTDLPARLYGGNAQQVEVSALDYTLHLDLSKLPESPAPTLNDGKWTVCWDEVANTYKRVEFSHLPAGDGIPGEKGDQGVPGPPGVQGPKGDPGTSGDWNTLTNKPATFPPSTHTHTEYVAKAGDTMTGNLTIAPPTGDASLLVSSPAGANSNVMGYRSGSVRWLIQMPDSGTESGANAGSNWTLNRYSDTGVYLGTSMSVNRASGQVNLNNGAYVTGNLNVSGTTVVGDVFAVRTATAGALFFGSNGARYIYQDGTQFAFTGSKVTIVDGTGSTSPTTGALTVAGGVGITKELWLGGATNGGIHLYNGTTVHGFFLNSADTSLAIGTASGHDIQFWAGNTFWTRMKAADGAVNILSATASTSSTTGALTVAGGVGIGGQISMASTKVLSWGAGTGYIAAGAFGFFADSYGFNNLAGNVIFAALDAGKLNIPLTTGSTSSTTGALTVAGGVGIAGQVWANNFATSVGNGLWWGAPTTTGTPGLNYAVGTFIFSNYGSAAALTINPTTQVVAVPGTTGSTSPTTGALTVAGGVGVSGAINAGGNVLFSSVTASISQATGALVVGGGVGVGGDLNVGGNVQAVQLIAPQININSGLIGAQLNSLGFYGKAPIAKQTGVPQTTAAIWNALVNLGLFAGP